MATALAYPDKEKGGRGKNSLIIKEYNVNAGYISQARFVLRHCRDADTSLMLCIIHR